MSVTLPKTKNKPDAKKILWCPYCDWHASDSMTVRKKMGLHVADEHYTKSVFPQGITPPDMEE